MAHIILHKVRGEPAFDVAEPMQIGNEEGWIIPTSGHRAYPYLTWPLATLEGDLGQGYFGVMSRAIPADWPDHYSCNDEKAAEPFNIGVLLSNLVPKIKRRM